MLETTENPSIRVQKFIADSGVTSRRKAEELILQGRVKINGKPLQRLGTKVNPEIDVVEVDEKVIENRTVEKVYLVMNKPRGYVTTVVDPEGRNTVMDLCQEVTERIYPVGRLDYLSEGLLIMTNDGDLANKIMHPRFAVEKVYEVKVFGVVSERILKSLRKGVAIDGAMARPKSVRVIKQLENKTWLEFRLGEGRNREIRRICEACHLTVDKLKRVAIGGLTVQGVRPGGVRYVTKKNLLSSLGMKSDGSSDGKGAKFFSSKKSINLKTRGHQDSGYLADDKTFVKYRKEHYFDTIKNMEIHKEVRIKREKEEIFQAKEDARQKRIIKKKTRIERKRKEQKFAHAVVIK